MKLVMNVPHGSSPDPAVEVRPRLLLVAPHTSYRIGAYINTAQAMGVDIMVVSEGKYSLVASIAEGIQVDFSNPAEAYEKILTAAHTHPFNGVVATDDAVVELAQHVAEFLGLKHNALDAARYARRKDLARARLREADVRVPDHWLVDLFSPIQPQLDNFTYPVVVKPVSMSGSRGVIRANTVDELVTAIERITVIVAELDDVFERSHVLIERYLDGVEVAFEGMLDHGRLQTLVLFDKPDALEGPYFEETIYSTPSTQSQTIQLAIRQTVADACEAYGLVEGPVHAELRLCEDGIYVLEVAARTIGGQCARLVELTTGCSLESMVIAKALSQDLQLSNENKAAAVMMLPIAEAGLLRRVEGLLDAVKIEFIEDIEISRQSGYELKPLPEGNSYLGFMFAQAPTAAQAEQALRDAHRCLKVVVAPFWSATIS